MSSATSSGTSPARTTLQSSLAFVLDRVAFGVRAAAFWIAALLPLLVLGALATGAVTQRVSILGGLLALNLVCAVVGHGHRRRE